MSIKVAKFPLKYNIQILSPFLAIADLIRLLFLLILVILNPMTNSKKSLTTSVKFIKFIKINF